MSASSERPVRLGHEAAATILFYQRLSIAEGVEVYLVDDWRGGGHREDPLQLVHVEVRHADRACIAKALRTLHAGPGPCGSTLGPMYEVKIHVVEPQPLQARFNLSNRILRARIELRRYEDVGAVDAPLSIAFSDTLLVPV